MNGFLNFLDVTGLRRPADDDDGGRLPGAVKDFEAPRACQPRLECIRMVETGGKKGGKLIYVMTSGIFHPENGVRLRGRQIFMEPT